MTRDRTVKAVGIGVTTTTAQFFTGPARLMGWAFKETTGAATATFDLYDGSDATAGIVLPATLLANESFRDWLGPNGLLITRGAFLNVLAGSVRGALWTEMLPDEASFYDFLPQGGEDSGVTINVQ